MRTESQAARVSRKDLFSYKATALTRTACARIVRGVVFFVRNHSLVAIAYTNTSDNLRRGDRILLQVNVLVLMLAFTVAFYYSKSTNCCRQLVQYLGCPEDIAGSMSGSTAINCMGCVRTISSWRNNLAWCVDHHVSMKFRVHVAFTLFLTKSALKFERYVLDIEMQLEVFWNGGWAMQHSAKQMPPYLAKVLPVVPNVLAGTQCTQR